MSQPFVEGLEGNEAFPGGSESSSRQGSEEKVKVSPPPSPVRSPKATKRSSPDIEKKQKQSEDKFVTECLERCKKKCLAAPKFKRIQEKLDRIVHASFDPALPSAESVIQEFKQTISIENWMGVFKKLVDQAKAKFGTVKNNSEKLVEEIEGYKQKLEDNKAAFLRIYKTLDPFTNDQWKEDKQGQKIVKSFINQEKGHIADYVFSWDDFLDYIVEDITKELQVPSIVKPARPATPPPSPGVSVEREANELDFVIPQERAKFTLVKQQNNFGAGALFIQFGNSLTQTYDEFQNIGERNNLNPNTVNSSIAKILDESTTSYMDGFWESLWLDDNQIEEGKRFIANHKLDQSRLMTLSSFTNMMENGYLPNPFIPYRGIMSETFLYMDRNQLNFYFWPDRIANSYNAEKKTLSKNDDRFILFADEFNDFPVLNWNVAMNQAFKLFESMQHNADTYQNLVYSDATMDECFPSPKAESFLHKMIMSRRRYAGLDGSPADFTQVFKLSWSSALGIPSYVSKSYASDRNLDYETNELAALTQRRFCIWSKNQSTQPLSLVEFQVSTPQKAPNNEESTSYIRLEVEQRLGPGDVAIHPNFWNKSLKFISKKNSNKAWQKVVAKNLIWDSYVDHILDITSILTKPTVSKRFDNFPFWLLLVFKGLLGFIPKNAPGTTSEQESEEGVEKYLIFLDLAYVRIEGVPDNEIIHNLTKYIDFGFAAPALKENETEIGIYGRQNFVLRSYSRYIKAKENDATNIKAFTTQTGDNVTSAILFRPFPTKKELFKLFRYFINDILGNFGARTYNITNLFDYLLKDTSIKTSVLDSVKAPKPKTGVIDELYPWPKSNIVFPDAETEAVYYADYPLYSRPSRVIPELPIAIVPAPKKVRAKNIIQSGISVLAWKSLFRSAAARKDYLKNHKRDQFKSDYFGFSFGTKLHLVNRLLQWIATRLPVEGPEKWANLDQPSEQELSYKSALQIQLDLVNFPNELNDSSDQISIFLLANNALIRIRDDNSFSITKQELSQRRKNDKSYNSKNDYYVVHPLHAVWYYRIQPRATAQGYHTASEQEEVLFTENHYRRHRILTLYDDYLTLVESNRIENELLMSQSKWFIETPTTSGGNQRLRIGGIPTSYPKLDRSIQKIWIDIELEIENLIKNAYQARDFWDHSQPISPALSDKPEPNVYRNPYTGLFVVDPTPE